MPKFKDSDMKKYTLIKSEYKKGCLMCYTQTEYIDYICEARMCSTECSNTFYKQIMKQTDYCNKCKCFNCKKDRSSCLNKRFCIKDNEEIILET